MKKIISAFLSVIMLVSLCLLASCNSTQPKDAGELFFDAVSYTHLTLPTTPYV